MKRVGSIFFVFYMLCQTLVYAQTDTSFWFAAPEVSVQHGDRPVIFRFASFGKPTNIIISLPATGEVLKELNLQANSAGEYIIDEPDFIEVQTGSIQEKGILIQATNPITAYYEVVGGGNNTDLFALKGKYALGKDFVVPMQNIYTNQVNIEAYSSVTVVATENNTQVSFLPSAALYPTGSKETVQITLNKGEAYTFRASTEKANNKLAGSKILSNKPIAVTGTDDSVLTGGNWDLIGDQLIPMRFAGTKYVLPKGYIAISAKKAMNVPTSGQVISLNAANNYSTTIYNAEPQIVDFADTVIINFIDEVAGNRGAELGGAILPPLVCSGSREVAFVRSSERQLYVHLVYRASAKNDFLLNNSSFSIPNNLVFRLDSNLSYAKIPLTEDQAPTATALRIKNTSAPFHLAIANGSIQTGFQLGYFSNFRNELEDTLYACQKFNTFSDYTKTLDVYGKINTDTLDKTHKDTTQIKFNIQDEYCLVQDTAWIVQSQAPIIDIADKHIICENADSVLVINEHKVVYNDFENSKTHLIKEKNTKIYVENKAGCSSTKNIQVEFLDSLRYRKFIDTSFCKGAVLNLQFLGNHTFSSVNGTEVKTPFSINKDSSISLISSNLCGQNAQTINVSIDSLPIIDLGLDRTICGKKYTYQLPQEYAYVWQDAKTTNNYAINTSGLYQVLAKSNKNCFYQDAVQLVYKPFDSVAVIQDRKVCANTTYLANLGNGHDAYVWNDGTNAQIRALGVGDYSVTVTTSNQDSICYKTSFGFSVSDWNLEVPNIITPNNDGKNETFKIVGKDENYPLKVEIYNRWGSKIYGSEQYNDEWGDADLSSGVYFHEIQVANFECTKYKGFILVEY